MTPPGTWASAVAATGLAASIHIGLVTYAAGLLSQVANVFIVHSSPHPAGPGRDCRRRRGVGRERPHRAVQDRRGDLVTGRECLHRALLAACHTSTASPAACTRATVPFAALADTVHVCGEVAPPGAPMVTLSPFQSRSSGYIPASVVNTVPAAEVMATVPVPVAPTHVPPEIVAAPAPNPTRTYSSVPTVASGGSSAASMSQVRT